MAKKKDIKTRLEVNDDPIIEISSEAWYKMWYIVQKATEEIGWLGSVVKVEDPKNPRHFLITDIWLMEQNTAAATCELLTEARDKLIRKLIKEAPSIDEGIELTNQLRFWGHSHVNMGVSPSNQDEKMIRTFDSCPWYIRGIFNKKMQQNVELYEFETNTLYSELELKVRGISPEVEAELDKQIKEYCKPLYEPVTSYGYKYNTRYNSDYYSYTSEDKPYNSYYAYYSKKQQTHIPQEKKKYYVSQEEFNAMMKTVIHTVDNRIGVFVPTEYNGFVYEMYKDETELQEHVVIDPTLSEETFNEEGDNKQTTFNYECKKEDLNNSSLDLTDIKIEEENSIEEVELNETKKAETNSGDNKCQKQLVQKYNQKTKSWEYVEH